jgi:hypothetical protein
MKVKEIISNQSVTINTGNFENQKINYGEVWEVEPGDNIEDLQKKLCNHVFQVVNTMANHVRQTKKLKQVVFKKSEPTDVQLEDFEREQRLTDSKPEY